jgi:1-phosphatidylinositol phosphodiesterase
MNQKLLPWLQARKGKRNGIVSKLNFIRSRFYIPLSLALVLDFYDAVPGLVEAVIGL